MKFPSALTILSMTGYILLTTLILSTHSEVLFAQSPEERILAVREASNAALKSLDEEANLQVFNR